MLIKPSLVLAWLGVACTGLAWIDTGHMVTAAIAERELTPEVRAEVHRLVKIGGTPRTDSFWTASAWADDTRSQENATWHYINLFFREDGKPAQGKPEPENAVWAIERFSKVLADRTRPDEERADALRYLIHFVGDVHQPLHAVARESDKHPTGDRGGNDFLIVSPPGLGSRNLHALWDAGAGLFPRVQRPLTAEGEATVRRIAMELVWRHPLRSLPSVEQMDPMAWAEEGLVLAKEVVYNLEEGTQPSPEYLEKARAVAGERAALAGYRLGELLNRLLSAER
jgi:hypothetical protein